MNNFIQILHIASNEYLDLFEDTQINLELVNDLLADELNSQTYSYQFKIPSTENNLRRFNFPTIVQLSNSLNDLVPVTLYLGGVPYKTGKLVNVNNVGDSIDNYMEFGFVGDKANIDLTKNIKNVFDGMDISLPHYSRNISLIRLDSPFLTESEFNAIGQSQAAEDPESIRFYGIRILFQNPDDPDFGFSVELLYDEFTTNAQRGIPYFATNTIGSVLAGKMTPLGISGPVAGPPTGAPIYVEAYGGGSGPGGVTTTDFGCIFLSPVELNNKKYNVLFARRMFNLKYPVHADTFYEQNLPFYNYDYNTLESSWATTAQSNGKVKFPTLKALWSDDNLDVPEDQKYDLYGGSNLLFPKRGDNYDSSKTYAAHVDTGLVRKPVYMFFGDPAKLYRTNVTDVANPGETPLTHPSKWVLVTDFERDNFINNWTNSGTTLDFDNAIYYKNQFRTTLIPCILLYKLVQQIFINAGIELVGEVINDSEFQKMIIVYNKTLDSSLNTENKKLTLEERKLPKADLNWYWNNYKTAIHLGDHLPDMSIADFLNALRNYFGIGFIFTDKKCEMVYMQNILSSTAYKDLSAKTVRGIQLVKEEYWGIQFTSERDSNDHYYDVADMTDYPRVLDLSYDAIEGKAKNITTPISPLLMDDSNDGYLQGSGSSYQIPVMGNKLSSDSYGSNESCNLRLLIYHGKTVTPIYADYATQNQFAPNRSTVLTTLKLDWTKLEELFWYNWERFVESQKTVKYRILIELPDILNFDFKQKIRIRDQNYMVKKVQIPIKMTGIDEIQKELYSVE